MSDPAAKVKIKSLSAAIRLLDDWIEACSERDRRIEADSYRIARLARQLQLAEWRAAQFEEDAKHANHQGG